MKTKYVVLIVVLLAVLIIAGIYAISGKVYDLKRIQMDTLYTYFHKIQDSIKAKHYPIDMDSLKHVVYQERNTADIYNKLKKLEDSVKAFK